MFSSAGALSLALHSERSERVIGTIDPHALKIPARRAEYSLTENVASPFQAEPRHSYGSKSTRIDFLLKDEQLAVEAKMTGNSLQEKQVLEQLAIDAAYYKQHPDCRVLVCLVYDPERRIGNPKGMEKDIGGLSTPELKVVGIVCS
jgi:DpnII restriction endonuclease